MAPRLIILGWDSATFDVADQLIEDGRLPALASLLERGHRAPLRSVYPAMTDCAWTCAFTGANPGRHGIFGSWYRAPGDYRCRYFSSRDRRAPALWELTTDIRHLVWNVPMAYPPSEVEGVMVSGYGAPPGARFSSPAEFQDELVQRWRLDDLLDRAPHGSLPDFRDGLIRGLDAQAEAVVWAVERSGADCTVAVWPHIDRAQHFFWKYRGTDHSLAGAVDDLYEAMDRATGAVVDAFPDADVLVVSDHGAGSLAGDVNLGGWLAGRGRATYGNQRRSSSLELAWRLPPPVRRLGRRLAPGVARRAFSATLAGQLGPFDWSRTQAFAGFHSDLWLNLRGREPQGTVDSGEADALLTELRNELLELTDPATGAPVFAGAYRRDELYSGPAAGLAPDLMLDPWTTGYRVAPGRGPSEEVVVEPSPLAGVNEAWSADHRPLGIYVAAGPRVAAGDSDELSLYDVCPTALALLEQPVPEGLDGRVATEAIDPAWLESHPLRGASPAGERAAAERSSRRSRQKESEFSDEEAAAVASHLKDLGYIE